VAAGPADPGAWDRTFGELTTFTAGDGEARARAHKAAALPARLAVLYAEVRRLREAGSATRERLLAIRDESSSFPEDWLLRAEVQEMLGAGELQRSTGVHSP
jgi:phenylalanine-4-hydroxylase